MFAHKRVGTAKKVLEQRQFEEYFYKKKKKEGRKTRQRGMEKRRQNSIEKIMTLQNWGSAWLPKSFHMMPKETTVADDTPPPPSGTDTPSHTKWTRSPLVVSREELAENRELTS